MMSGVSKAVGWALVLSVGAVAAAEELHLDFVSDQDGPRWSAVNDGVMGGLSQGGARMKAGVMHFSGTLSLENNGGFASVRTQNYRADLSGTKGIRLRVFGDGRTYQLRVSTDARFRQSRIAYKAEFTPQKGEWTEVDVPFVNMVPSWRGRLLEGPELDLSKITQIGILLGDKKEGPFSLKVDWMKSF
ncbi:CIA30 family protein [Sulfuriroseicoccus oceanibius]|uniref:CIA30 family protein n=1 Tax=Sulfuriroseicoccus oceanibius TaxID=2707525 RepID=A0A7T7JD98_9BACT|nr:CIA30 family protein [Sulfuriroseicoccus oceanibius]QQL46122.1 CIA30 family protein [Sulfuriroseicoccus oceanibius]